MKSIALTLAVILATFQVAQATTDANPGSENIVQATAGSTEPKGTTEPTAALVEETLEETTEEAPSSEKKGENAQ